MKIIPRGFEHLPALKNLNYVSFGTGGGDPKWEYFHIINEYAGDNVLTINLTAQLFSSCSLEYSFDKKTWEALNYGSTTYLTMPEGSTVYLRGTEWKHIRQWQTHIPVFTASQNHSVGGCIVSLRDYVNMKNITELPNSFADGIFFQDTKLTSLNFNVGNVTKFGNYCFAMMCYKCESLVDAQIDLENVVSFGDYCFEVAFSTCSKLVTSPLVKDISSIGTDCLRLMFENCVKLTTPLYLSNLTTIGSNGCKYLYYGCRVLDHIYAPNTEDWNPFNDWICSAGTSISRQNMYFKTQESMDACPSGNGGYGSYTKTLLA